MSEIQSVTSWWPIIITSVQGVIVVVLALVLRSSNGVRHELAKTNGSIGKLFTWSSGHEALDDARFEAMKDTLQRVEKKLDAA